MNEVDAGCDRVRRRNRKRQDEESPKIEVKMYNAKREGGGRRGGLDVKSVDVLSDLFCRSWGVIS